MKTITKLLCAAALTFAIPAYVATTATTALAADAAKKAATPADQVKKGLRIFNQVVTHTGRIIEAKDYAHVAHEHEEAVEGAEILRKGLKGGPADMNEKAEPAVAKALAASTALKDASATKDDAKIKEAHAAFAAATQDMIALFPEDMRPQPKK
jgi:hypothetical protein